MDKNQAQLLEDYGVNVEAMTGIPVVFPEEFEADASYIFTYRVPERTPDEELKPYFEFMKM